MKKILLKIKISTLIIILISLCTSYAGAEKENNKDIYLLIGQSNMAGRIKPDRNIDVFPEGRVFVLADSSKAWGKYKTSEEESKEVFVPAGVRRLNEFSTIRKSAAQVGPGLFFARVIAEERPERIVCIVSNARGGSSINQWKKGGLYFNEAVRRTKEAEKHGTLRGVIWHQGETDYNDKEYLPKLVQFVKDLREALNAPNVPFIAGQITPKEEMINKQIAQLPTKLEYCDYVSSEGMTTMDRWHFDRKSITKLGEQYARKLIAVSEKMKKESSN